MENPLMELQERSQVEEASPLRASHSGILPVRPYVDQFDLLLQKTDNNNIEEQKVREPSLQKEDFDEDDFPEESGNRATYLADLQEQLDEEL